MTGWLIAAFVATTLVAPVGAESTKVSIFVGPQTRDGFVDVDTGVLDSIKDIRDELRSSKRFVLVPTEAAATIVLTVVGRRTAGQSGSVGVPIAGMLMMLPSRTKTTNAQEQEQ